MAWWPSSIKLPGVAPAIQVEKQLESFWAVGHLKGGENCISIQAELMAWSSKKGSRQENNEGIELVISRFNLKKGPEALWRWDDGHTMADEYSLRIKWGWLEPTDSCDGTGIVGWEGSCHEILGQVSWSSGSWVVLWILPFWEKGW